MKKRIIRSFRRQKKAVVKKSRFLLRHPLLMPVCTFIVLFFVGLIGFIALGGSTQGPSDARIVDLYVDGKQRTVTTRAKNIGELLDKLQVPLIAEDIVEPAKDTLILEDNTQINIYRARPVEIIDGARTKTLLTAQRAPRLVAADAGLSLYPEDEVSFERTDATILDTAVSEQLVIDRSVEIQLNVYGAIKLLRTTAKDVEGVLKKEGIVLSEGDTVEPVGNQVVTTGMLISVNKPGVKTVVVSEPIAYETQTKDDAELQAGKSRVDQEGVNGERAVVYELVEKDGAEVSRKEIQQVVLKQPIAKIVARGTKIVSPAFSSSVTVAGDKAALMAAAGISESDYGYVDYVISRESNWRPGAANTYSGAYGLCQALPGSKMASAGGDYQSNPVTQLEWCSGYATGRYGSWGGAYRAWQAQGWW